MDFESQIFIKDECVNILKKKSSSWTTFKKKIDPTYRLIRALTSKDSQFFFVPVFYSLVNPKIFFKAKVMEINFDILLDMKSFVYLFFINIRIINPIL